MPSHYTIRSDTTGPRQLWLLEAAQGGENWWELDRTKDKEADSSGFWTPAPVAE
jgi:hypothetical protein